MGSTSHRLWWNLCGTLPSCKDVEGPFVACDVMQLPRAGKKLEETLVYLFQGGHGRVLLKSQERTWTATWDDWPNYFIPLWEGSAHRNLSDLTLSGIQVLAQLLTDVRCRCMERTSWGLFASTSIGIAQKQDQSHHIFGTYGDHATRIQLRSQFKVSWTPWTPRHFSEHFGLPQCTVPCHGGGGLVKFAYIYSTCGSWCN